MISWFKKYKKPIIMVMVICFLISLLPSILVLIR